MVWILPKYPMPNSVRCAEKKIAMVFQSFALMPHMTVLDNTAFGMELAGINAEERREKALDALRQVGLENYAHSYPDELSAGCVNVWD